MSSAAVDVKVLLFAGYADLLGRDELAVSVASPATIEDVVREFRRRVPGAERLPAHPLIALNRVHARFDQAVEPGDEVAILPPLAGG